MSVLKRGSKALAAVLLTLGSIQVHAAIECDGQKTIIQRVAADRYMKWADVSILQTSDLEILHFADNQNRLDGYVSKELSPNFKSFFYIPTVATGDVGFNKMINLDLAAQRPDGSFIIDLTVKRNSRTECLQYDMSDCYAGDTCSMKCLQPVEHPEVIYIKKQITCFER